MQKFLSFIYALILLTVSQSPTFGQVFNYSQIKDYNTDNTANVTSGNALQVDITSSSGTANVNLFQIGGSSVPTGNGVVGVGGVQRVTLASDGTGHVIFWDGTNTATVSAAGALKVDGSAVTQPVSISGTVPVSGTFWQATQPVSIAAMPSTPVTGTFWQATQPVSISGNQATNVAQVNGVTPLMGNGVTGTGSQRVTIASDNTAFLVNAAQSGTWNIGTITTLTGITNNVNVADVLVQAAATSGQKGNLPLAACTTSAPTDVTGNSYPLSLNTAGGLRVDGSGVTQPVSGTVSEANLDNAQGSTTSGQKGPLIQGAVTTASPSYTNAQTSPLSLDTTGALRVNVTAGGSGGGAVTQSGTWANQLLDSGGTNKASVSAGGALKVDGSAVTQPVSQAAATVPVAVVLQNAATATGNGTVMTVTGYNTAYLSLTGTFVANVNFEESADGGTTWVSIVGAAVTTGQLNTNVANVANDYQFNVAGGSQIRARISSYTSGSVTVKGWVSPCNSPVGFISGGVSVSSLPALPANQSVNVAQMNGIATSMGNGTAGTGTQRVTIAADSTGQTTLASGANVIGALTANQSVNITQFGGATLSASNPLPDQLSQGGAVLSASNPLPTQLSQASMTPLTVLQNAVSATGNGSSLAVSGYSTALFEVSGTFTSAIVEFDGSVDGGTTWWQLPYVKSTTTYLGSGNITFGTGLYSVPCAGMTHIRAPVTWTSGTSITVKAIATTIPESPRGISAVTNQTYIGGGATAVSTNAGSVDAGCQRVTLANNTVASTVSLNAASSVTNGSTVTTTGYTTAVARINHTGTATITWQASDDNSTWFTINATPVNSTTAAGTATTDNLYSINCDGIKFLRAAQTACTTCSTTVTFYTHY